MTDIEQTVFIVDDDEAVRDSLNLLLSSVNLSAQTYASAQDFLATYTAEQSGCLLLDVRMPGMSGLELASELRQHKSIMPIIFITGHGDVPMAVQAMRLGAMDFIQKPFRDQELLDRIYEALKQDAENRQTLNEQMVTRQRLAGLTPRECEVLNMLMDGKANKTIAVDLGVSQRTVETHRARIMEKMHADSIASLVQMTLKVQN